jgi:4-hydroxybenzoate polyprenyltransferase
MIAFLKLIRLPNLLIVAGTQYLMRFAIIDAILGFYNKTSDGEFDFVLQMSEFDFFILVLATVCLTAAGYVINDYFDTKTDSLNRPKTVVVGKSISRRSAMAIHIVLNAIGVIGGFYASWKVGHPKFGFIFVLAAGILWYYSTTYKRQFLIGNMIVALLTAMVPLIVILFEIPVLNRAYSDILIKYDQTFNSIFNWVVAFSFFAFFTTLIREIIKDAEDFEGDNAYGRKSLPIVLGVTYTKIIIIALTLITITALVYIFIMYLMSSKLTLWYLIIAQLLPFIFLIIKVITAKNKKDYSLASLLMKFIMLFGVLYSLVAGYIFLYTF